MTREQIIRYADQAFAQCAGWTLRDLAEWIAQGTTESVYDIAVVLETYLPGQYAYGDEALHCGRETWWRDAASEYAARVIPEPAHIPHA